MKNPCIHSNQLENPWPEHEPNEYPVINHNEVPESPTPTQNVEIEHFDGC